MHPLYDRLSTFVLIFAYFYAVLYIIQLVWSYLQLFRCCVVITSGFYLSCSCSDGRGGCQQHLGDGLQEGYVRFANSNALLGLSTASAYMFVSVFLITVRRSRWEVHICRVLWSEAIQTTEWCGSYHAGVLFTCGCWLKLLINCKVTLNLPFPFTPLPSIVFPSHSPSYLPFSSPAPSPFSLIASLPFLSLPVSKGHSHNASPPLQRHP